MSSEAPRAAYGTRYHPKCQMFFKTVKKLQAVHVGLSSLRFFAGKGSAGLGLSSL